MKRLEFIRNTATVTVVGSVFPELVFSNYLSNNLEDIGIQLFSLPKLLEEDFRKGMGMLAEMGYSEIELFGPFPFSAESAKKRWGAVTSQLGFSGSGFFGRTITELKSILDEFNLRATSIHTDLETLQSRMPQLKEAAQILGFEYVVLPSIPENKRETLDDYKRMAAEFNAIGMQAKKAGLKFAYHNHGYGLKAENGQIPLQIILDETDPELVFFEMDIYWTTAGGANPVDFLESYPGRYKLMHFKDMKKKVTFSGDGGTPDQWISLFPYMTSVGDGVLDIKGIIQAGLRTGVEHFYVEQDMVDNPETALKKSIDNLKKV